MPLLIGKRSLLSEPSDLVTVETVPIGGVGSRGVAHSLVDGMVGVALEAGYEGELGFVPLPLTAFWLPALLVSCMVATIAGSDHPCSSANRPRGGGRRNPAFPFSVSRLPPAHPSP